MKKLYVYTFKYHRPLENKKHRRFPGLYQGTYVPCDKLLTYLTTAKILFETDYIAIMLTGRYRCPRRRRLSWLTSSFYKSFIVKFLCNYFLLYVEFLLC